MTLAQKIAEHLKNLPESAQAEVLDFVEFLETKAQGTERPAEDRDWQDLSLAQALRAMEDEESPYDLGDLRERFQ